LETENLNWIVNATLWLNINAIVHSITWRRTRRIISV